MAVGTPNQEKPQQGETNHPLFVQAESEDLSGCDRDNCKLWGAGILRFVAGKGTDYRAQVILTAAGCENCNDPAVTQGDFGVKVGMENGTTPTGRERALEIVTEVANIRLAEIVQAFAPAPKQ